MPSPLVYLLIIYRVYFIYIYITLFTDILESNTPTNIVCVNELFLRIIKNIIFTVYISETPVIHI